MTESKMFLNYQGHDGNSLMQIVLQSKNAMLMWIAIFGGLHISIAVLKLPQKIFLKVAGGHEYWFRQVLQHLV